MDDIRKLLRTIDRRLLPFIAVAVLVVFFCFYKALGAFGTKSDRPDYERRPAPGLSSAPISSIIDPQDLSNVRLPDEVFVQVSRESRRLSPSIAATTIAADELRSAGVESLKARQEVEHIRGYRSRLAGMQPSFDGPPDLTAASADSAGLTVSVNYRSKDGIAGPTGRIRFSYARRGQLWQLDGADFSLNAEG